LRKNAQNFSLVTSYFFEVLNQYYFVTSHTVSAPRVLGTVLSVKVLNASFCLLYSFVSVSSSTLTLRILRYFLAFSAVTLH
jgi:hypothetical protein